MFSVWQNGPTRLKSDFLVHRFQTFTFGIGYTLKIGRVPPEKNRSSEPCTCARLGLY